VPNYSVLSLVLILLLILSCKGPDINKRTSKSLEHQTTESDNSPTEKVKAHFAPQIHGHLNGMVSEFVWKAIQDKEGNFWFGTNHNGLIKYDGTRLINYDKELGEKSNAVRDILEDKEGNLWLGTCGGLIKYDGKNFTKYYEGDEWDNEIWEIEKDYKGRIWMATNTGAKTLEGGKIRPFISDKAPVKNPKIMISNERVNELLADSKGTIWISHEGQGISEYGRQHFKTISKENGLPDNNVADIFEDSKGNIWIGTFYGGVSKYDGTKFTNFTLDGMIKGIEAYSFCEDKKGNIWFSVENIGVYRYDGENFQLFNTDDGLTTNGVLHIFPDQQGRIWFFTWSGISIYEDGEITDISEKVEWAK